MGWPTVLLPWPFRSRGLTPGPYCACVGDIYSGVGDPPTAGTEPSIGPVGSVTGPGAVIGDIVTAESVAGSLTTAESVAGDIAETAVAGSIGCCED